MPPPDTNNYAFIDSQNVNLSIREIGWRIDFARFRVWLNEKYRVSKAYLFIGYIEGNEGLYKALQEMGYICIFKPTLKYKDGRTKGNCDAELVLQAMIDFPYYKKAVIVTGDGDFYCLVDYLIKQGKLCKLLIPDQGKYSALLKRFPSEYVAFLSAQQKKLEKGAERAKKERTP